MYDLGSGFGLQFGPSLNRETLSAEGSFTLMAVWLCDYTVFLVILFGVRNVQKYRLRCFDDGDGGGESTPTSRTFSKKSIKKKLSMSAYNKVVINC